MMVLAEVCAQVPGLAEEQLRTWLEEEWVRPLRRDGVFTFREVDVARVRLIMDLHREMAVEAPTVPLVLSLLDQLFATRRQLRLVLELTDPPFRERLAKVLEKDEPLRSSQSQTD
jgi:chaperone modulatory protein CbpM